MAFRFRRSTRLGPLRFNFSKGGLSSISVGGRGASFNIPVSRSGSPRSTLGVPGTGLSWSVEHAHDRPIVNTAGLLAVIETPEAIEAYVLRAQGQDDAKRRAHRCIEAVQDALRLSADPRRLA
jgi:hypothetical protein